MEPCGTPIHVSTQDSWELTRSLDFLSDRKLLTYSRSRPWIPISWSLNIRPFLHIVSKTAWWWWRSTMAATVLSFVLKPFFMLQIRVRMAWSTPRASVFSVGIMVFWYFEIGLKPAHHVTCNDPLHAFTNYGVEAVWGSMLPFGMKTRLSIFHRGGPLPPTFPLISRKIGFHIYIVFGIV